MLDQYISNTVLFLIGASFLVLLWLGYLIYKRIKPVYDAQLSVTTRERIDQIAKDAYAWAEKNYAGMAEEKFHQACTYLSDKLKHIGIKIPPEEIEAAIQKAWEDFNPGNQKKTSS